MRSSRLWQANIVLPGAGWATNLVLTREFQIVLETYNRVVAALAPLALMLTGLSLPLLFVVVYEALLIISIAFVIWYYYNPVPSALSIFSREPMR